MAENLYGFMAFDTGENISVTSEDTSGDAFLSMSGLAYLKSKMDALYLTQDNASSTYAKLGEENTFTAANTFTDVTVSGKLYLSDGSYLYVE